MWLSFPFHGCLVDITTLTGQMRAVLRSFVQLKTSVTPIHAWTMENVFPCPVVSSASVMVDGAVNDVKKVLA